ncbi:molybdopterin synthase catalytic subunit [Rhizomicrobium palustre]|uniref:Molybdopterin synthase catalytic subunit n=1 Tax=Rhizomicrobium palustre TaxID=189966 RepID=A0A846MWG3_9PROT|nr:molybdenum cofactor biosynthesis protein MoaE [Rhizomicrobium palustre]NIK87736.1 molybdopterin synthase catalytic subunit [Rhizomicrobium palustre]
MILSIQETPFDVTTELARIPPGAGAIANFIGYVRGDDGLKALHLEYYPGMTEREIARHIERAQSRWPLHWVSVIHRVGTLRPGDPIVFVAVAAKHRSEAFAACEFLMDHLKTKAPFWKEERFQEGSRWVEAKASDDAATERWSEA